MNTENFIIEVGALVSAQDVCRGINGEEIRNRAVANAFAANIAASYFDSSSYKIDTQSGLHNIASILEHIDIADIYINNSYIDVRIFFNEDELCVPKSQFDHDMLPVAYMFIKVDSELSGASVKGFILPENIDTTNDVEGYYKVDEVSLKSFYDIEPLLFNTEDSYAVEDDMLFDYIDNNIEDKYAFYKDLLTSESARNKLIKAEKAQYIFNFVSIADKQQDDGIEMASDIVDLAPLEGSLSENELMNFDDNEELLSDENNEVALSVTDFEPISEDSELSLEYDNFKNLDDSGLELDNSLVSEVAPADIPTIDLEEPETIVAAEEETEPEALNSSDSNGTEVNEDNVTELFEDNSFEYSTVASPSIDSYEDLEGILDDKDEQEDVQDVIQEEPARDELDENSDETVDEDNSQQIDALFNEEVEDTETMPEETINSRKPAAFNKGFLIVALLVLISAVGYFGYAKFSASENNQNTLSEDLPQEIPAQTPNEAMPIESVNNNTQLNNSNEGTSEAIPMIEQNLDASILVSNLKVDWEVPAAYTSNTSAKRYLIKLGKIIQLNLKSELLLLSKPPITNRIAVEIKYNPSSRKFETVGISASSGEKSVDDLILQTVNKALGMNLSINTDSLSKLQGNPLLIIHL